MQIKLMLLLLLLLHWFDKSPFSPFDLPDNKLNFMWILRVTCGTSFPTDLLSFYRTAFSCLFNDSFAKHLKESRHFKLPCPTMY